MFLVKEDQTVYSGYVCFNPLIGYIVQLSILIVKTATSAVMLASIKDFFEHMLLPYMCVYLLLLNIKIKKIELKFEIIALKVLGLAWNRY